MTESEIKVRGRRSNQTASDDILNLVADDVGRIVMVPYQVRDLISSGRATPTRGGETAVLSAVASAYLDVVTITASNTSDSARTIDIRSGTGTGIVDTLTIGAATTVSKTYQIPLLASETATPWTAQVQGSDLSDSPVTVVMVAIQNI